MVRIHVVMLQREDISGYDTDVTAMATDTAVTAVTTDSAVFSKPRPRRPVLEKSTFWVYPSNF